MKFSRGFSKKFIPVIFLRLKIRRYLQKAGVELVRCDLNKAPITCQQDPMEVLGTFTPRIVRMNEDKKYVEID